MTATFNSLPELMNNCPNSLLIRLVSNKLRNNHFVTWKFVSGCVVSDDYVTAKFETRLQGLDKRIVMSSKITPQGVYHHSTDFDE